MDEYMENVMDDHMEFYQDVSGNESYVPGNDTVDSGLLNDILETLNGTQSYGTIGDYYNQDLGCYVFPNFDVYEYFIDIDAAGHEWAETSDGHYVPLLYLDAYEWYRSGDGEEEEAEEPVAVLPGVTETETLETLESIRGLLSVIKANDQEFYGGMQELQEEQLETGQRALSYAEGTLYAGIVGCVLTAVIAGTFVAHAFFGRMRAG